MKNSKVKKNPPDPRSKEGPFGTLFKDIQHCKIQNTCPSLDTRQFYFEPNSNTASIWVKEKGIFGEQIDNRVMFICESPGPSAAEGGAKEIEPCFYASTRDDRFLDARKKYGFANCYITNTVKCGVRQGGSHQPYEIEACRKFLLQEIDLIKPMIMVGVGGNAYKTLRAQALGHLEVTPVLFQITHYSCRRDPWNYWKIEFPELLKLLSRLRPREDWDN